MAVLRLRRRRAGISHRTSIANGRIDGLAMVAETAFWRSFGSRRYPGVRDVGSRSQMRCRLAAAMNAATPPA
jgi:hypothetical protein